MGLAAAIALTINAHYFGILLLVPLCAAEGFRSLQRGGRIGQWWWRSIAVMAGFAATWPFLKAAGEFRRNYYNAGSVGPHDITRAYRSIFVTTRRCRCRRRSVDVVLVAFAAALAWGAHGRFRARDALARAADFQRRNGCWLLVLAALPICGYLLAR